MPTDAYWIENIPSVGRLGTMPRPRGGDWLVDEIAHLKSSGVSTLVSLLTAEEVALFDLEKEASFCVEAEIDFRSFPIDDVSTPVDDERADALIRTLHERTRQPGGVAIHCRIGIGRSSMIAASVMAHHGIRPTTAFAAITKARGLEVPDTAEQIGWVEAYFERMNTVGR